MVLVQQNAASRLIDPPGRNSYLCRVLKILFSLGLLVVLHQAMALPSTIQAQNMFDAKAVSLNLQDGKTKVFLFLSSKCPCSSSHEPLITDLYKEFSQFQFIAINSNSNEELAFSAKHFEEAKFPFPVLRDNGAKVADEFRALKTPHAFIVNGNGKIIYSGGVTNTAHAPNATKQYLREALQSVAAGKNPDPSEVRTLGCVISRP